MGGPVCMCARAHMGDLKADDELETLARSGEADLLLPCGASDIHRTGGGGVGGWGGL